MTRDDQAFLDAFEAGRAPGGAFRHADHLRLAWILVRRDGAVHAEERIAAGIRRFAAAQGKPDLYHETLTRAWVRLVAAAIVDRRSDGSFEDFLGANAAFLDKGYVLRFYSTEALSAPRARREWLEPDLAPLPHRAASLEERRAPLLRAAFLVGAVTDGLAVLPLMIPSLASLLWGVVGEGGSYRFVAGCAASLMLAWTGLLLWAYRRPLERAFVAPLTVLVIYGLVATEVAAVLSGHLAVWRMLPTWILQSVLLCLFASAYHAPTFLFRHTLRA